MAKLLDLAGTWYCALDRHDQGLHQAWYSHTLPNPTPVRLPGSLAEHGLGDPITIDTPWTGRIIDRGWFHQDRYAPYRDPAHLHIPFWLQPKTYYRGVAWYQRDITIPTDVKHQRLTLHLERPHWQTQAWLNDQPLGPPQDSLATPHEHAIPLGTPPGTYRLTLRVNNDLVIPVGWNSHSVSDHTQSNWNGIVGDLALHATPPVWINNAQAYPRAADHTVQLEIEIGNATGIAGSGQLTIGGCGTSVEWDTKGGHASFQYKLPEDAQLWDEFHPHLHTLRLKLESDQAPNSSSHRINITFGFRDLTIDGTQFAINGIRRFLRGALDCCVFPLTGYPPTDTNAWHKIFERCRAFGLNHIRFHSYCPPRAAFVAADELGIYLQVECSSWANSDTSLGDGGPLDTWLYDEAGRIIREYGNHPSFCLLAYGNEPGGERHPEYLTRWLGHWTQTEPRRLHTGGAGWPALEANQYHNLPDPRLQRWGEGLDSRLNASPPETCSDYADQVNNTNRPLLSHETGQWCAYPDFTDAERYTGVLRPGGYTIWRDSLESQGMAEQAHDFHVASGKLQSLCYKEETETALRTPGLAGFQLLGIHDFPGQGFAPVGVLNAFYQPKAYTEPEAFRQACAPVTLLARLPRRVYTPDQTLEVQLDLAHFGPHNFTNVVVRANLVDAAGQTHAQTTTSSGTFAAGHLYNLGQLQLPLADLPCPGRFILQAKLQEQAGGDLGVANTWNVWLFPTETEVTIPPGVRIADALDRPTADHLSRGGSVMLFDYPMGPHRVALGFTPVFWNTSWTHNAPPHTLGLLIDHHHPALRDFPTEPHTDWQWWDPIRHAHAMTVSHDDCPDRPILQPIDTWTENHRCSILHEQTHPHGPGRLLRCSINLRDNLHQRPVARQLFRSILAYLAP